MRNGTNQTKKKQCSVLRECVNAYKLIKCFLPNDKWNISEKKRKKIYKIFGNREIDIAFFCSMSLKMHTSHDLDV